MKTYKSISTVFALFVLCIHTFAGDQFLEAMKKGISEVYQASDTEQLQKAVNLLERIGAAEKSRWEPYYYAGFGYIMMANLEQDARRKDEYLDQAMVAIEKAKTLSGKESEVLALEGFAYMIRVTVDPGSRGAEWAPKAMETFSKAIALNPDNPRALALSARMQFGTAQFFGSSTKEACDLARNALEKFNTFQPSGPLSPQWGKAMASALAETCN
jgi:tetratricopeptide (TPR) repeat protein